MRCAQAIRDMLFRNLECKRFWQCENDKTSVAWIGECPSALHAGPRVKRGLSDELKKIRSRGCLFPRVIDALQGQEAVTVMANSNAAFQNVASLLRGGCATHFPLIVFSASTPDSTATKNFFAPNSTTAYMTGPTSTDRIGHCFRAMYHKNCCIAGN